MNIKQSPLVMLALLVSAGGWGCTVKAVGDRNRPIVIEHHITLDVKGLEKTATNIENYVSGKSK